ncbi:hypothetical protein [Haloarcula sp. Atlit-47R]
MANELGCHRTTAHDLLTQMEDNGLVKSKQVGSTLMWKLDTRQEQPPE